MGCGEFGDWTMTSHCERSTTMAQPMLPGLRMFRQYWLTTLKSVMLGQLWVLRTGLNAAQSVMKPTTAHQDALGPALSAGFLTPPPRIPGPSATPAQDIVRRATE